jgi:hypothetical protein
VDQFLKIFLGLNLVPFRQKNSGHVKYEYYWNGAVLNGNE